MTRLLAAMLAVALLALSSMSLTSPASAQIDAKAKEKRTVSFLGKDPGNKFFLYGKVEDYKNKRFTIERKIDNGPWKVLTKVKTKSSGKWQLQVFNTKGTPCFRAKVAGSAKYKPYTTPNAKVLCIS